MQAITPELEAILKDHFQAAASGFRGRIEVDVPNTDVPVAVQQSPGAASTLVMPGAVTPGNTLVVVTAGILYPGAGSWDYLANGYAAADPLTVSGGGIGFVYKVAGVGESTSLGIGGNNRGVWYELPGLWVPGAYDENSAATATGNGILMTAGPISVGANSFAVAIGVIGSGGTFASASATLSFTPGTGWTEDADLRDTPNLWVGHQLPTAAGSLTAETTNSANVPTPNTPGFLYAEDVPWTMRVVEFVSDAYGPSATGTYYPSRISKDKSLRMTADQAEVTIPNEGLPLGWGPTSVFPTNARIRIFEWFGDEANAIRAFTGIIDAPRDARDLLTTVITCRDMFAILIDQTFSTTAPQGAEEDGSDRTEANGVYLNREISYIVNDILDRAGWPAADRAITETSYVLDEFMVSDGASWADTIVGQEQLTGLVGYDAWADELGIFHFAPTASSDSLTDPGEPVYTFRTGEDITSLGDSTDQYELRTRVKIRGPLVTVTLKDVWAEQWRTSKFSRPVGLWYAPSEPLYLRVLDRGSKRMYKLRQSDRAVISSVYLGSVCSSPLGLSGDPADATVYWVLNCPWISGGGTSGNTLKKIRKSDNHVLASFSLPNGRWSAVKVSAAFIWLTNLDTDRFYKRSKTDGSAIANYSHTYGAVVQANPSGIMVDGTTLHVFWSNGGTTARFLICDEGSPGTVDRVIRTAGTVLHGGEMDTTTHTECYGDSDSLGLVAKFTLVEPVETSEDVSVEVIDSDLEDELGILAQLEDRTHDAHSGDAAHPFEVRRETIELTAITSFGQATETARRWLDRLAQRRRVVDVGIIGNPAIQKTDLVRIEDPVTGLADDFVIDTYRSEMSADSTYVGTLALLPVTTGTDDPTDDGSADEDP